MIGSALDPTFGLVPIIIISLIIIIIISRNTVSAFLIEKKSVGVCTQEESQIL